MSRVTDDDYDEDWNNQAAFWRHNAQRALKGKRGKKALAELREALLMLPQKRLVSGAVSTAALEAKYRDAPDEVETYYGGTTVAMRPNWERDAAREKCAAEGIGVCAVGAYLVRKRVLELGETPEQAMENIPAMADVEDHYLTDTAYVGEQAGLSSYVAYILAERNDEKYRAFTPEQRYNAFLNWIDEQLAEVPA